MTLKDKLLLFIKGSSSGSSTPSEPKQKRVREKKITRLHLILAGLVLFIVIVVVIVIKIKIDNKDVIYRDYEQQLVTSTEIYYDLKDIKIKDGSTEKVYIEELKSANLVNIDSSALDKCEGYVETVSQKNYNTGEFEITRKAYIKCENKYKTINYIGD